MSPSAAPSASASIERCAPFRSGKLDRGVHRRRGGGTPLGQALDDLARRHHPARAAPVDHLAVQAPADRAPEVLLDLAARQRLGQLALVVVEGRLRDAGADQRRQGERLVAGGLRVADPELDRPEPVMGPHAPPELRRLDDRAGRVEALDEPRVRLPVPERLVDAAAREGAGEDLGANRVKPGVMAIQEG